MKWVNKISLTWLSGFLGAAAFFHALPFVVRHDLKIGEVWMTDTNAFIGVIFFTVLAVASFKLGKAKMQN